MSQEASELPFSPDEVEAIRDAVRAGKSLACPRCGARLLPGEAVAGGGTQAVYWSFRCDACNRGLVLSDLKSE